MATVLSHTEFLAEVKKLAHTILERNPGMKNIAIIGVQQGGVVLANHLMQQLKFQLPGKEIPYGKLDITFYRDDLHKNMLTPDKMHLPFAITGLHVILIDDVLFTGRTIKAALDALLDYGRPERVELCVLIDRHEHRQFPIQADYVGMVLETAANEKVKLIKKVNDLLEVELIKP
ncbi:MAG: bifunctional pyr operon transcriptional regulator/uracil phosphoribosyltransferase PyrR [Ferruginibacter sp.]|nr:bifunctional pyr operon transcriptional regulator/uracil phosphoribosyltransferase PyrR [Ferruginibacter sp.]